MDAALGGAGSQLTIHAEALARGAQERQKQDGEGVQEQEAVATLRIIDPDCAHTHSEAKVLAVAEARFDIPFTIPLIS